MDYTQRAVESILENETLTADLDDQAADLLLDWAMSLAKEAAQGVAGINEASAEEQFGNRMRNVRQFIRQVNRWAANPAAATSGEGQSALNKVLELAAPVYGEGLPLAGSGQVGAFSQGAEQMGQAGDRITSLRQLLEVRS